MLDLSWSRSNSDLTSCEECNHDFVKQRQHRSLFIPSFVSITRKRSIERRKQIEKRTGEWDLSEIVVDHVDKIRRELAAGTVPEYADGTDGDENDDARSESASISSSRFTAGFTKSSSKSDSKSIKSNKNDNEEGMPLEDLSDKASTRHGSVDLGRNGVSFVAHAHRGSIDLGCNGDASPVVSVSACHRHHGHAHKASLDLPRRSLDVSSPLATGSSSPFMPGHAHQRASIDMGAFTRASTTAFSPFPTRQPGVQNVKEATADDFKPARDIDCVARGLWGNETDAHVDALVRGRSPPLTHFKACQMEEL